MLIFRVVSLYTILINLHFSSLIKISILRGLIVQRES